MASEKNLESQLASARQRVEDMIQTSRQLPSWQHDLLETTLRDFSLTLKSMQDLADKLRLHDQELAESRLALAAEKQRYRKLFDLSPTGYLVTNGEGLIWETNTTAARLLDTNQSALYGKLLDDFIDPQEQSVFRARLAQLRSGRSRQFLDWILRLKPGTERVLWLAVDVTAVQDERNELVGLRWLLRDTTHQKQSEEALRKSEERYRRLLGSVTDYVYTVEIKNNRPVSTSHAPGCEAVTGYTPEEYAADPQLWLRMVYRPDQKKVLRQARRALAGDVYQVEHRIIHKDGSMRWVRNTPVPRYNDQNLLVAYDGLITDITDRVHAREALQRTSQQFQELVQSIDGIVWEADLPSFLYTYVSPQAERILGYPNDHWTGSAEFWNEHIFELDRDAVVDFRIRQVRALQDFSYEYRMVAADGRLVWLQDVVTVVVENEQPVKLRGVMVDITQRKQAEQALQEAQAILEQRVEERTEELTLTVGMLKREIEGRLRIEQALEESQRFLQTILDFLPTPVFYQDVEGIFLGCNKAFEKHIGLSRRNIIGKKAEDLAPPDLAREYTAADQALLTDLAEQAYEAVVQGPDGIRRDVIFNKAPFYNPDQSVAGLVGSIFDITERKRMEAHMMRTERLAAMGSVAATLAHEIKNPLQTILSNVELVLDFGLDPEESDDHLRLCYHEIERLIGITTRLLNLALPSRSAYQLGSYKELIRHILTLVANPLEQANIQVSTKIAPDLPEGPVPEQIVEVLLNLITNAIEALPGGGTIHIEANCDEDAIYLSVTNSGEAIAPDHLEQIFEPFFTTKPFGTGLGLPISHNIIQQLGGTITAENLSQGVRFTIVLPAAIAHLQEEFPDSTDPDPDL